MFSGATYGLKSVITSYEPHPLNREFRQATIFPTSSSVRRGTKVPLGAAVAELAKTSKAQLG